MKESYELLMSLKNKVGKIRDIRASVDALT